MSDYSDEEDIYTIVDGGADEEAVSDNEEPEPYSETASEADESEEEPAEEEAAPAPEEAPDATLDKDIIIIDPDKRKTSHILSRHEMTEIVGIRATQIAQTGICMVDIGDIDDAIVLAKKELMARRCPLMIEREVGERRDKATGRTQIFVERWSPNTMTFAAIYTDI